jgi:hypothetical protein
MGNVVTQAMITISSGVLHFMLVLRERRKPFPLDVKTNRHNPSMLYRDRSEAQANPR